MRIFFLLIGFFTGIAISLILYKVVVKKVIIKFEKNKRGAKNERLQ